MKSTSTLSSEETTARSGKDGIISLVIEANPKPHLERSIRDQLIKKKRSRHHRSDKAEELRDLGRGLYEAVLIIADIRKHDTETQYILKVYNDMGSYCYVILISTSAELEDLEIGVLSIIGIVIAKFVFVFKKKEKTPENDERQKITETVEIKIPTEESQETKDVIVYAQLDLVNPNLKLLGKNFDDKTKYVEIVYTQRNEGVEKA
ncbi:hypothetical protein FQR65_LT09485 [Abscondita terminalis]|nr:hypothetical protein FQR65_LT09485 [Abscondita terminalis]